MQDRLFIVFAGPNGSGKSTLVRKYYQSFVMPELYVNADDISRKENLNNIDAANKADALRAEAIKSGIPFVTETVFSRRERLSLLKQARRRDYNVHLVFVTTSTPEINVSRVQNRVQKGGHDVPEDKIRERHPRANALLPLSLCEADSAEIYDNSGERYVMIAEKYRRIEAGQVTSGMRIFPEASPDWSEGAIERLCGLRT